MEDVQTRWSYQSVGRDMVEDEPLVSLHGKSSRVSMIVPLSRIQEARQRQTLVPFKVTAVLVCSMQ